MSVNHKFIVEEIQYSGLILRAKIFDIVEEKKRIYKKIESIYSLFF